MNHEYTLCGIPFQSIAAGTAGMIVTRLQNAASIAACIHIPAKRGFLVP